MHVFPNLEEHGSLFKALFFKCIGNIYQLFPILEEIGATNTLDFDMNNGYVLVNYRDQEWEGIGNGCDYLK